MTRDPRIDPQPGDSVLASEGRLRVVTDVIGNHVYYRQTTYKTERNCSISAWRGWCEFYQVKPFLANPKPKEEPSGTP